jgi:hypothetical protein
VDKILPLLLAGVAVVDASEFQVTVIRISRHIVITLSREQWLKEAKPRETGMQQSTVMRIGIFEWDFEFLGYVARGDADEDEESKQGKRSDQDLARQAPVMLRQRCGIVLRSTMVTSRLGHHDYSPSCLVLMKHDTAHCGSL